LQYNISTWGGKGKKRGGGRKSLKRRGIHKIERSNGERQAEHKGKLGNGNCSVNFARGGKIGLRTNEGIIGESSLTQIESTRKKGPTRAG